MTNLRTSFRKVAKEAFCASLAAWSHVDRRLRVASDLQWMLILTMPNSGSTALGKLLMTSKAAVALTERCEGEWLIPSMSNLRTRWNINHAVPMTRVRARWLARLNRTAKGSPRLVIEKSPPNMIRIDQLRRVLAPMTTHTVILARDPYAVCEGWHRRYGKDDLARTSMPRMADVHDEQGYFRMLGEYWAHRAGFLVGQIPQAICVIRYEDLTADPAAIVTELSATIPLLADAVPTAQVDVKDYGSQKIRNMNESQIAALSDEQVAAISDGLRPHIDVVERLGYALRD